MATKRAATRKQKQMHIFNKVHRELDYKGIVDTASESQPKAIAKPILNFTTQNPIELIKKSAKELIKTPLGILAPPNKSGGEFAVAANDTIQRKRTQKASPKNLSTYSCGLYDFFERISLNGVDNVPVAIPPSNSEFMELNNPIGRAWSAEELSRKSFEDLHTLWWVLVRERNLLETQKHEARQRRPIGVGPLGSSDIWHNEPRLWKIRQAMARIKTVLSLREKMYREAKISLLPPTKQKKIQAAEKNLRTLKSNRWFRKIRNRKLGRNPRWT